MTGRRYRVMIETRTDAGTLVDVIEGWSNQTKWVNRALEKGYGYYAAIKRIDPERDKTGVGGLADEESG
jgi:hypothetical protein